MKSPLRWLNYLPASLQNRIEHNPNILNFLSNMSWLFMDKIIRMLIGLFIGVWVARYLGPEQFGLLNFATAFVSLFGVVAALGLQDIVVRDLVKEPELAHKTLGTAFSLQLWSGLFYFIFFLF